MDRIEEIVEKINLGIRSKELKANYHDQEISTSSAINKINNNNFNEIPDDGKKCIRLLLNKQNIKVISKTLNKTLAYVYTYKKVLNYVDLNKIPIDTTASNIQLKQAGLTPDQIKEINPIVVSVKKEALIKKQSIISESKVDYFKILINNTEINIKSGTKGIFISNEGIFIKN